MVKDGRPVTGLANRMQHAELLCAFANTLDVDVDADPSDAIPDPPALTRWLRDRGLIKRGDTADWQDVIAATTLRRGIRGAMRSHHTAEGVALDPELESTLEGHPLRVSMQSGQARLVPAVNGVPSGLARIVIAMMEAEANGYWTRLKLCAAEECALAFCDLSKNQSRQWCSMSDCGNRRKTLRYRNRHRPT